MTHSFRMIPTDAMLNVFSFLRHSERDELQYVCHFLFEVATKDSFEFLVKIVRVEPFENIERPIYTFPPEIYGCVPWTRGASSADRSLLIQIEVEELRTKQPDINMVLAKASEIDNFHKRDSIHFYEIRTVPILKNKRWRRERFGLDDQYRPETPVLSVLNLAEELPSRGTIAYYLGKFGIK